MTKPKIFHIPICPFSQRVEILLELKGLRHMVEFEIVDITKPRPPELLAKLDGTTALPMLETPDGGIIKESLVILRYIEDLFPDPPIARADPYERAVENMLIAKEGPYTTHGYLFVMNQDAERQQEFHNKMLDYYRDLNRFLMRHAPDGTWLFDRFGMAECVYTSVFQRFWFLEYYEGFQIPDTPEFARVKHWHDACIAHPAAQQVSYDELIKLYYDYAKGAGNGALVQGRSLSSFVFEPDWPARPMPPKDKYGYSATDAELGLI